jgi:hypothetical protein
MAIETRAPPLASILPQLKALAARFLPDNVDTPMTSEIRNLSYGPLLDSFCLSLFDAEENYHEPFLPTSDKS